MKIEDLKDELCAVVKNHIKTHEIPLPPEEVEKIISHWMKILPERLAAALKNGRPEIWLHANDRDELNRDLNKFEFNQVAEVFVEKIKKELKIKASYIGGGGLTFPTDSFTNLVYPFLK